MISVGHQDQLKKGVQVTIPGVTPGRSARRLRISLVSAALLCLAACSEDASAKRQRYLSSGEKYFKEGKFHEAALQFRNAIQLDPKSAEAHYGLARTHLSLNNADAAFNELVETVTLQPGNWDAQLDLANLHTARREYDKAAACVAKVLKANPDHPLAHATLAMKHAATRDWVNATAGFEKAIQLAPDRVDFYTGLAKAVYIASGKLPEAESVLRRATAANPNSVAAHMELARFYVTQRRPEGLASAQAAVDLEPKAVAPRLLLSRAYNAAGRVADAEKVLRELKSFAPNDPQAYLALGGFYEQIGDREKAVSEFQAMLASKPKDISVKQRLIENLIGLERWKEAETLNKEVLKSNNDDALAHFAQGRILLARDQKQEALAELQRAAALAPYNAQVHYLLGTLNAALGNPNLAKSSLAKAIELQPEMTQASVALAGLAVASGDREAALRLTDRALQLDPRSLPAQVARAQALLAKGDFQQGEAILTEVLAREPASAPALTLMAAISARQGKIQHYLKRISVLVEQQPKNAELRYLLALATHIAGDARRAELEATEVLRLDPKTPRIHLLLASIHLAAGKTELVKSHLRLAIDSDPRNVGNYLLLAERFEKEQNWDEAKRLYEKARQLDPDSPVVANQLAYLYLERGGDLNAAFDLAQQAKQKLPNSPEVSDTLGWAYYKRGMATEAILHLSRCVESLPSNSACQYHLGMAYLAAKDPVAASKHLQLALKDPNLPSADSARQALNKISKGTR